MSWTTKIQGKATQIENSDRDEHAHVNVDLITAQIAIISCPPSDLFLIADAGTALHWLGPWPLGHGHNQMELLSGARGATPPKKKCRPPCKSVKRKIVFSSSSHESQDRRRVFTNEGEEGSAYRPPDILIKKKTTNKRNK